MLPLPQGLILLSQPVLVGISLREMQAALPPAWLKLPCEQLALAPGPAAPDENDLRPAAADLFAAYRDRIEPVLRQHPDYQVIYFGAAPIPLAFYLGWLVATWPRVAVVLRHHGQRAFGYFGGPAAPAGTDLLPRLRPYDLPAGSDAPGDVVVRLSTSYPVDVLATRAQVPDPLWEVDLGLLHPHEDAFRSSAEVEAVADAWKGLLDEIARRFPRVQRVHLFAAVQTGLAFLLGTRVNRALHPPVQTYMYHRRTGDRPALLINQDPREPPTQTGGTMDFQRLFRQFHEKIQLTDSDHHNELRQRRDEVLGILRDHLQKRGRPSFVFFNSGSYEMGTGIRPRPGGDYDIDVGVIFAQPRSKEKPLTVKGWVHEALPSSLGRIKWRRPCITVFRKGYHVDVGVFVQEGSSIYLAIGKQNGVAQQAWQQDGIRDFIKNVKDRYPAVPEDGFQLRRVVRYLKRWKDIQFPPDGVAAPTGLLLTVMAYHFFSPRRRGDQYDDLKALKTLLENVLAQYQGDALTLPFPFSPGDNLLRKMSAEQVRQLKGRLHKLLDWLDEASRTGSAAPLQKAFGADFPAS